MGQYFVFLARNIGGYARAEAKKDKVNPPPNSDDTEAMLGANP